MQHVERQVADHALASLVILAFLGLVVGPVYAGAGGATKHGLTPIFNKASGFTKVDPPSNLKLDFNPPKLPSDTSGVKLPGGETLSSTKEIKALLPPPTPNVPKGPTF